MDMGVRDAVWVSGADAEGVCVCRVQGSAVLAVSSSCVFNALKVEVSARLRGQGCWVRGAGPGFNVGAC